MIPARTSQQAFEFVGAGPLPARITQYAAEVVMTRTAPSPTTITGGGISQQLVEVVMVGTGLWVKLSQNVFEVVVKEGNIPVPTTTGTKTSGGVA